MWEWLSKVFQLTPSSLIKACNWWSMPPRWAWHLFRWCESRRREPLETLVSSTILRWARRLIEDSQWTLEILRETLNSIFMDENLTISRRVSIILNNLPIKRKVKIIIKNIKFTLITGLKNIIKREVHLQKSPHNQATTVANNQSTHSQPTHLPVARRRKSKSNYNLIRSPFCL